MCVRQNFNEPWQEVYANVVEVGSKEGRHARAGWTMCEEGGGEEEEGDGAASLHSVPGGHRARAVPGAGQGDGVRARALRGDQARAVPGAL